MGNHGKAVKDFEEALADVAKLSSSQRNEELTLKLGGNLEKAKLAAETKAEELEFIILV